MLGTKKVDFDTSSKRRTKSDQKTTYSLSLPTEVFNEIKRIAEKDDMTYLQVIRNFIKFGLAFCRMKEQDPDTKLIIRQGKTDHVILWF